MMKHKLIGFLGVLNLSLTPLSLSAESTNPYEITARFNIIGSSGRPTNDVLGFGFTLHRKLSDDWYLGFNLDHSPEFDFERPSRIVGISSVGEVDAIGTMTMLTVVGERRYALASEGWTGFWNLGAGINEVDLDDADGDVEGGGSYDIETDVDTEFVLLGSAGWMQQIGENWSARYAFTAELHSSDWDVRDKNSASTGSIDDYELYGLRIGMTYRF